MYFCNDIDLLPWEPGVFLEAAFAHQAYFKSEVATLTGTALVMDNPVLTHVAPGMVAAVTLADGSLTQLLEITAVADASHATVSALRARNTDPALSPLTGGAVKVTLVSFRPQIAAVGDLLLACVGVASDRDGQTDAVSDLAGFRSATLFGTLAALFRTLADAKSSTAVTFAKKNFYDALASGARRGLRATIDLNADGTPETAFHTNAPILERV